MNTTTREALKKQLQLRAFSKAGVAPNKTMVLDDGFLDETEIYELFDTLVSRREKVRLSYVIVGADAARKSWDDVVAAIDAIKAVMAQLSSP